MSLRQKAEKVPLLHLPGDFGALSRTEFTLATEHGMFRMTIGGYSGLSATEKYWVIIRRADGSPVTMFDVVRKYTVNGVRVNCVSVRGLPGFNSLPSAVEALSRHFIAGRTQRQGAAA